MGTLFLAMFAKITRGGDEEGGLIFERAEPYITG
jgi:hypothetical protein